MHCEPPLPTLGNEQDHKVVAQCTRIEAPTVSHPPPLPCEWVSEWVSIFIHSTHRESLGAAASAKHMSFQVSPKASMLSTRCRSAGRLFHICGPATANDLSPRRVLVVTRQMWTCRTTSRRLASEMSWQSPDKYRGIWPCSVLYMNVASLKSTRRRTGNQCSAYVLK